MKPNRFSALQIQNLAPLGGSFQGATWATSFRASWFWGSLSRFFVKSSRGNFESVKPNRLSSLGSFWSPGRFRGWASWFWGWASRFFFKSSRESFQSVKPDRFSGLVNPKPRTPRGGLPRGLLGAYLGYFVSGFMVLGFPLMVFREIIEREFQKCGT